MTFKLSKDMNGNKTLKFSPNDGSRGFSIQTNGNLPQTHAMMKCEFNENIAENEFYVHVRDFGTMHQKDIMNIL